MKINYRDKKGNLMIESLVAISITLIGLLGIFGLLSRSLDYGQDNSQKFVATYLAAEGIEVVRSLVDANYTASTYPTLTSWNSNIGDGSYEVSYADTSLGTSLGIGAISTTPLNFDSATGIYSYSRGSATPFARTVRIANSSDGQSMKIVSIVNWQERGSAQSVSLEDYFYNWRP